MCTYAQIDIISKKMAQSYYSVYGDAIVEIILYGSYARGDNDEESDVDIVAIVNGNRIELQDKLKKVWDDSVEIGMEQDVVVSPTIIPLNEFEKYKDVLPYYRNIVKEGKKIG